MKVKLIAWGEGDRTVGDGTLTATLDVDVCESDVDWAKDHLREMLNTLWDVAPRFIHVMTEEEFKKFQEDSNDMVEDDSHHCDECNQCSGMGCDACSACRNESPRGRQ